MPTHSSDLSPEQKALQETARQFVKDEVIPNAAKYDKSMEYPWEILKKAHSVGLLNVDIPSEYGKFPSPRLKLQAVSTWTW